MEQKEKGYTHVHICMSVFTPGKKMKLMYVCVYSAYKYSAYKYAL